MTFSRVTHASALTFALLPLLAAAHGSGDMSMNMNMSNSTMATMGTYFTTTIGSSQLWFPNWIPTSSSATAGSCIGLALLAIVSRLLAAVRSSCEASWSQSILRERMAKHHQLIEVDTPSETDASAIDKSVVAVSNQQELLDLALKFNTSPAPFTPSIDFPRASLFMLQAFVGYLLMLAVMTYSAWFFIAILAGLGLGELAFGRWANRHGGDVGLHF